MILVRNRARCLGCNEVIESKHRHDFRRCACGKTAVDGGLEYVRRSFSPEVGYEDMNEYRKEENR